MATDMPIANRYDFVYLFDVSSGNPNGDPDAGNMPRIDPETGHGLVTDVCLKRKVRNFVSLAMHNGNGPLPGYDIFVKDRGILAAEQRRAYVEANANRTEPIKATGNPNDDARDWMCQTFYDVRTFGAVMTTGKIEDDDKKKYKEHIDEKAKKPQWNCGQVRGPVQLTFARSIEPILSLEHAITRVALTNASDTGRAVEGAGDEKAASGQMGRKATVPYGLYRVHGFVSPQLAARWGFTETDLNVLWRALISMFNEDHSAARGQMTACGLYVFKHENPLGNAPAHVLFDRITVKHRDDLKGPPRRFADYRVEVEKKTPPANVKLLHADCRTIEETPAFTDLFVN